LACYEHSCNFTILPRASSHILRSSVGGTRVFATVCLREPLRFKSPRHGPILLLPPLATSFSGLITWSILVLFVGMHRIRGGSTWFGQVGQLYVGFNTMSTVHGCLPHGHISHRLHSPGSEADSRWIGMLGNPRRNEQDIVLTARSPHAARRDAVSLRSAPDHEQAERRPRGRAHDGRPSARSRRCCVVGSLERWQSRPK
jgi:hypothetical protein